ncbi:MAG: hypothetical protein AAF560_32810 [Acidobacteriota bacterium]
MKLSAEAAQDLYQQATHRPPNTVGCLSAERLRAAAQASVSAVEVSAAEVSAAGVSEAGVSAAELRAVAQHVAECSTCAQIYLAARRAAPPARAQPRWPLQLAAALVLMIGAGWLLRGQLDRLPADDVRRTGQPAAASTAAGATIEAVPVEGRAAVEATAPVDGAELTAAPTRLSWRGHVDTEAQRLSYEIEVMDERLEPLWQSRPVAGNEIGLPDSLRHRLAPGATFYWRVVTLDQLERRESPLYRFRIVGAGP